MVRTASGLKSLLPHPLALLAGAGTAAILVFVAEPVRLVLTPVWVAASALLWQARSQETSPAAIEPGLRVARLVSFFLWASASCVGLGLVAARTVGPSESGLPTLASLLDPPGAEPADLALLYQIRWQLDRLGRSDEEAREFFVDVVQGLRTEDPEQSRNALRYLLYNLSPEATRLGPRGDTPGVTLDPNRPSAPCVAPASARGAESAPTAAKPMPAPPPLSNPEPKASPPADPRTARDAPPVPETTTVPEGSAPAAGTGCGGAHACG